MALAAHGEHSAKQRAPANLTAAMRMRSHTYLTVRMGSPSRHTSSCRPRATLPARLQDAPAAVPAAAEAAAAAATTAAAAVPLTLVSHPVEHQVARGWPEGLTPLCATPAKGGCSRCCPAAGMNPLLPPPAPPQPPLCMCADNPSTACMGPACQQACSRCAGILLAPLLAP